MRSNVTTLFEQCEVICKSTGTENVARTIASVSPFYQDYLYLKRDYPNYYVMVRLNEGYFTFGKDAQRAAKVLGLEVITREVFLHPPTQVCFLPLGDFSEHFQLLTQSGAGMVLLNHDPNNGVETFVVLSNEDARKAKVTKDTIPPVQDNFEQMSIF